eukprot:1139692-Pelagomonas_calceolata.AAC.1
MAQTIRHRPHGTDHKAQTARLQSRRTLLKIQRAARQDHTKLHVMRMWRVLEAQCARQSSSAHGQNTARLPANTNVESLQHRWSTQTLGKHTGQSAQLFTRHTGRAHRLLRGTQAECTTSHQAYGQSTQTLGRYTGSRQAHRLLSGTQALVRHASSCQAHRQSSQALVRHTGSGHQTVP